jgi:hypothetical protein
MNMLVTAQPILSHPQQENNIEPPNIPTEFLRGASHWKEGIHPTETVSPSFFGHES